MNESPLSTAMTDATHPAHQAVTPRASGAQRVMRLLLVAMLILLIVGVMLFGVLPYVDAMTQPTAPPLPPAVHT
ncbi:MAG: hypothetical protein ACFE0Q_00260 [Anaerolineae bacterium]